MASATVKLHPSHRVFALEFRTCEMWTSLDTRFPRQEALKIADLDARCLLGADRLKSVTSQVLSFPRVGEALLVFGFHTANFQATIENVCLLASRTCTQKNVQGFHLLLGLGILRALALLLAPLQGAACIAGSRRLKQTGNPNTDAHTLHLFSQ